MFSQEFLLLTNILECNRAEIYLIYKIENYRKGGSEMSSLSLSVSVSLFKNKETFNKTEGELLQYVSIRRVSRFW